MPTFLSPVGFNSPGATIPAIIGPAGAGTFGTPNAGMQLLVRGPFTDQFSWSALAVVSNDAAAIDKGGSILLGGNYTGNTASPWARIGSGKTNNTDGQFGGYLTLATRPNGGSVTERLRINEAGLVGIGANNAANGLLTIGTNTANTAGGVYFGTDTSLYRSAAGVLKTNQLDQVVRPVETNTYTTAPNMAFGTSISGSLILLGWTLPFDVSSIILQAFIHVATGTPGIQESGFQVVGSPTPTVANNAVVRSEGGTGVAKWVVPIMATYGALAKGSSFVPYVSVINGSGGPTILVSATAAFAIAIRA